MSHTRAFAQSYASVRQVDQENANRRRREEQQRAENEASIRRANYRNTQRANDARQRDIRRDDVTKYFKKYAPKRYSRDRYNQVRDAGRQIIGERDVEQRRNLKFNLARAGLYGGPQNQAAFKRYNRNRGDAYANVKRRAVVARDTLLNAFEAKKPSFNRAASRVPSLSSREKRLFVIRNPAKVRGRRDAGLDIYDQVISRSALRKLIRKSIKNVRSKDRKRFEVGDFTKNLDKYDIAAGINEGTEFGDIPGTVQGIDVITSFFKDPKDSGGDRSIERLA